MKPPVRRPRPRPRDPAPGLHPADVAELQMHTMLFVLERRSAGQADEAIRRDLAADAAWAIGQVYPADPWIQEHFVSVVQSTVDDMLSDWD